MHVHAKNICFECPASLIDETRYSFKISDLPEMLSVVKEPMPNEGITLNAFLLSRLRHPSMPRILELSHPHDVSPFFRQAGAEQVGFSYRDSGQTFRESWIYTAINREAFVCLMYKALVPRYSEARLQTVLSTTHLHEHCSESVPEGFYRYQAGQVCLGIPAHLQPPSTYSFLCLGRCGRITLMTQLSTPDIMSSECFTKEIERERQFGVTVEDIREEIPRIPSEGRLLSYITRPIKKGCKPPFQAMLGRLRLSNGAAVSISATHTLPVPEHFKTAFQQIVSSVQPPAC
jgi:hypothetical protein